MDIAFEYKLIETTASASGTSDEEEHATSIPGTGFPIGVPGARVTARPASLKMDSSLSLSIPALGVSVPIVGVPLLADAWDVSWLDGQAGWLEGSAYPTWAGNSVLTGHVWDANDQPGPFADLRSLKFGDAIEVLMGGSVYRYEVRSSELVSANAVDKLLRHEDRSWLTLVTCEGYDAAEQSYRYRRMVRAVLLAID